MNQLNSKGRIIILSAPSGAGKTTISNIIIAKHSNIIPSISITTRPKSDQEIEGKDYFFLNKKKISGIY